MKHYLLLLTFLISANARGVSWEEMFVHQYRIYEKDGFTHQEIKSLLAHLRQFNGSPERLITAIKNPTMPKEKHSGERFFQALAWYRDTTAGDGNGRFELREWKALFDRDAVSYLQKLLSPQHSEANRLRAWKMLQKMKMLGLEIHREGDISYNPRSMATIDFGSEWNAHNTIRDIRDFRERVLRFSFTRPVLVKFGLTYCIHCLLLENLDSIPAVARKYEGLMDVYKLWWNPKGEAARWGELNALARINQVNSSPWFILYSEGQVVRSGYAFPDEEGDGMEEFLDGFFD